MDFKFISPSEMVETFAIIRNFGYGYDKKFYCKNLTLPKMETGYLKKKLENEFRGNYFAFGQWYMNNRALTSDQNKHLFFDYQEKVKKINLGSIYQEKNDFINSFNEKVVLAADSIFFVFFNILDFYDHAFNWEFMNDYIISVSPRISGEFGWNSLRHEMLHIIFKKNSNLKVNEPLFKKISPRGYENEEDRVILDEIMVLALCLFFLPNDKIIKTLSFYDKIGYEIIREAYETIKYFSFPIKINLQFQEKWIEIFKKKVIFKNQKGLL